MSSVGGAAPNGMDPSVYALKETAETAIFTAAFGPLGPMINQAQNVIVSQVLPMLPDGPEKQVISALIDPLGALLTALMPPAGGQAQCAGYASGGTSSAQYGATAEKPKHGAVPVGTPTCEPECCEEDDEEVAPPPTVSGGSVSGKSASVSGGTSVTIDVSVEVSTSAQAATGVGDTSGCEALDLPSLQQEYQDTKTEKDAWQCVADHFNQVDNAAGILWRDGRMGTLDLNAIADGNYPDDLKKAVAYLMNNGYEKFDDLWNAVGCPGDGAISLQDINNRIGSLDEKLAGIQREIDFVKSAPPPPPPPPADDTISATAVGGGGGRGKPKPAPLQGKEGKEVAPRAAPVAAGNIAKVKPLAQKEIDDAKAADAAAASGSGTANSSGSTQNTGGSSGTKHKPVDTKGEFFPSLSKSINSAYGQMDDAEAALDKLIAQQPPASEAEIHAAERKVSTLQTRIQMLEQLYQQMMTMMQNTSKLYNDIAMNAIRHIG